MSWKDDPGREVLLNAQRRPTPKSAKKASPGKKGGSSRKRDTGARQPLWIRAATGGVLGMFIWLVANQVGVGTLPIPGGFHQFLVTIVVGAIVGLTRLRSALWVLGGSLCLLMLGIGYTPWIKGPTQALVRNDTLQPADAVVVLSSSVRKTGEMDTAFQVRVIHGYEVLGQGYAPTLVVTRLARNLARHSVLPAVKKQMAQLQLDFPVEEVGPVSNTRDEAVKVAQLAQERGWKRVILVSDPTHMQRAGATFTRAGLKVIHSPCRNPDYDISTMEGPQDRLRGFQDWFHETIGYVEYRRRGWL